MTGRMRSFGGGTAEGLDGVGVVDGAKHVGQLVTLLFWWRCWG